MSERVRLEATYSRNHDFDPASVFDIHSSTDDGGNILYIAESRGARSADPADASELIAMELRSSGKTHTLESHGIVADVTTAMMAQVALLQLRIGHRASQEHEVRGITSDPEIYVRALAMRLEDGPGEDGKSFLVGTVETVMGRVATLLNAQAYKTTWHQPLPRVVGRFSQRAIGE